MRGIVATWPGLNALDPGVGANTFIVVNVARQQLYLFKHGARVATWPVSTSRYGTGERRGSFRTPLGLFMIARKVGAGLPEFAVLNRHGPVGWTATPVFASDDPAASRIITARILMLEGLEPGWNAGGNVDTYARHIYIHGTANLGQLGEPASEGCVQMAPGAMITLFRAVHRGTLVLILQNFSASPAIPGEHTPLLASRLG